MKRILFTLMMACTVPVPDGLDIDPTDDAVIPLEVSMTGCAVAGQSDDFEFSTLFAGTGTLTVEVTRPDGTSIVVERRANIPGQASPARIPASAWGIGRNTVTVWVQRIGIQSALQSFTVDVRMPVSAGASSVDADGDCYSPATGDCNDSIGGGEINPGQEEVCADRVDNNCDGLTDFADPVCAALCADDDHDGYAQRSCGGADCDDTNDGINPGAAELCDGVDNNCNNARDEAFDLDNDGFVACTPVQGGAITWRVESAGCPDGMADCADCSDDNNTVYPGAFEPCDDILHNCKGSFDDKFMDTDGDDHLNCEDPDADNDAVCDPGTQGQVSIVACETPEAADGKCCSFAAGAAPDNCPGARNHTQSDIDADGIGDACDTCSDADDDTYGRSGTFDRNGALAPILGALISPPGAPGSDPNTYDRSTCGGGTAVDCDDVPSARARATYPTNTELCDGFDNNCDTAIDEGFDVDGDGFTTCGSRDLGGVYGSPNGAFEDCNDTAGGGAIYPRAENYTGDTCNGIDNDCDGSVDENADADGDTYVTCAGATYRTTGETCVSRCGTLCQDCDDTRATVYPGAPDVCDGLDNDCDEGDSGGAETNDTALCGSNTTDEIDEDFDVDDDGYVACPGANYTSRPSSVTCPGSGPCEDCNDTTASVRPNQTEDCNDKDDNCANGVDEGCDDDNDNYCEAGKVVAFPRPSTCTATTSNSGDDCNDGNAAVSPGAPELPCDNIDNNCSGARDEINDADGDTYTTCGLGFRTTGAAGGTDCNDNSNIAFPAATEAVCFNGQDDDCGGEDFDWEDSDCCDSVARYNINRIGGAGVTTQENFDQYDTFIGFPAMSLPSSISSRFDSPAPSASANATGGWEHLNLTVFRLMDEPVGDQSWRVRGTTLFELAGIDLGSRTAGTYGNGGDWTFQASGTTACTLGTGCFVNNSLVSPMIDFSSQTLTANDIVLLEYRRFSDHETVGAARGLQHTSNSGAGNVCDFSTAVYGSGGENDGNATPRNLSYSSASVAPPFWDAPAPGPIMDVPGQRCDACVDGEYANFADFYVLVGSSSACDAAGEAPCYDTVAPYTGQCFMSPTFQNAAMLPNGTAYSAWVPSAFSTCPLSAQPRDHRKWSWVYGRIPTTEAVGQRRVMFRYSTWDNQGAHGAVRDDGVYIDDFGALICRRP